MDNYGDVQYADATTGGLPAPPGYSNGTPQAVPTPEPRTGVTVFGLHIPGFQNPVDQAKAAASSTLTDAENWLVKIGLDLIFIVVIIILLYAAFIGTNPVTVVQRIRGEE